MLSVAKSKAKAKVTVILRLDPRFKDDVYRHAGKTGESANTCMERLLKLGLAADKQHGGCPQGENDG